MTQLLVVAAEAALRDRLTVAVQGMDRPVVSLSDRSDAFAMLNAVERQVMIYAPGFGGDVGWVAEALEQHPGLRVVYLSPSPWVSLAYDRARCLMAPHTALALNIGLLRRVTLELLAVGPKQQAPAMPATIPPRT